MLIYFQNIKINDFLSHEDTYFNFLNGITILEGRDENNGTSVGSGKSSIFDALVWCLYGIHPKGLKLDEVKRFSTDSAKVEVKFGASNNQTYRVVRQSHPSSLELYVNDERVLTEHKNVTQKKIEEIMGCDLEGFLYSTYFTQDSLSHFLMLDPSGRKDLLFKIQGIDKLDVIHDAIKDDNKVIQLEIESDEDKLKGIITDIDETKEIIKSYRKKVNDYVQERANEIAGLDNELKEIDIKLEELKKELQGLEASDYDVEALIKEADTCRSELEEIEKFRSIRAALLQKLEGIDDNIKTNNAYLLSINTDGSPCPQCLRPMNEEAAELQRDKFNKILKELHKDKEKIQSKIAKAEGVLSTDRPVIEKRLKEIEHDLVNCQSIPEKITNIKKMSTVYSDRKMSIKQQRGKLLIKSNDYIDIVKDFNEKLVKLENRKGEIEKRLAKNQSESKVLHYLRAAFGPHGIRSFILDGVLSELNHTIKGYLSSLYEENVDIVFTIFEKQQHNNKYTYRIDSRCFIDGEEWTFNALSGGEKRRAILAVDLALAKVVTKRYGSWFNIIILDEVTTGLDEPSRAKFYELLQLMSSDRNVYLIDHAYDRYAIRNANTITVLKKDGISRII